MRVESELVDPARRTGVSRQRLREIGEALYLSPNTVKSHLRSIYRKLAVGTRRDAVHRARRLGLLRQ